MILDLLILLNNFLHDLASAVWFCGTALLLLLLRRAERDGRPEVADFTGLLLRPLRLAVHGSLGVVLLGGVIRALAYTRYEWLPAVGRGQVVLLVVKHILLVGIVLGGLLLEARLRRRFRRLAEGQGG